MGVNAQQMARGDRFYVGGVNIQYMFKYKNREVEVVYYFCVADRVKYAYTWSFVCARTYLVRYVLKVSHKTNALALKLKKPPCDAA